MTPSHTPTTSSTSRLIDMQPNPPISPLNMPHLGVGWDDLDPLGVLHQSDLQSEEGMLFVPLSVRGIGPRGLGVPPPGARFDPFRPPGVDDDPTQNRKFRGDDLPPPGFDDI